MKKRVCMHVRGEYAPQIIKAMTKGGYKLVLTAPLESMIHLEFKPRKK